MGENNLRIPEHLAIILDGNGRWAKAHHVPRAMGHKAGCEAVENIVGVAARYGIRYLTVYGFSTENWKRSQEEVDALMSLFRYYMKRLLKIAKEKNCRVRSIGDRTRFPEDIIEGINALENETAGNDGITFVIAVNYGSRDEIRRAVRTIAEEAREGKLDPAEITEETVAARLDTAGLPDPDLLIRTGSEMRLSNFLLYQAAYTEIYVTDTLWPDFGEEELLTAIRDFSRRERRFGGRKESDDE